ncbi:MAG: hypothetical protein IJN40_00680 [Clostridia bacterium]|nr:hypothetical protein [Clostridia bacterium]
MTIVVLKIIPLCITSLILILFIKNTSSQFSVFLSVIAGVMIIICLTPYINSLITKISGLGLEFKEISGILNKIIKVVIIAVVCEFASQVCLDVGEKFLSSQVCFAGKIAIIGIISTDIFNFIAYLVELIKGL